MPDEPNIPAIILVRPQLGENIGKAARAMLNFGLTELRLVAPRDGWPNPDAGPSAAGADDVIADAKVFPDVAAAIADLNSVYAATVRRRELPKRTVAPAEAATEMRAATGRGDGVGILFGAENAGLSNEEMVLADCVWTVPVNPDFSSLNLAQAVGIAAYEWFKSSAPALDAGLDVPATKAEMQHLLDHFEDELDARTYFRPPDRKASMVLTLRNMFQQARFSSQQVQTLRGVIKSLTGYSRTDNDGGE